MPMTTYLAHALMNHVYRNTAYTSPTTVYLAAFTTATDDSGGGTEVTGGSYARVAMTLGAPAAKAISNSAEVNFGTATANWGTISHLAVMDASTAGNMLSHSAMTTSRTVNNGDSFSVPVGDFDLSFN